MNIRLTIYVVVVLIILSLLGATKILYDKWRTAEKNRQDSNAFNLSQETTINWYKNKLGMEVAKVKTLSLSYKNLKDLQESERIKFVRKFEGVKKNLRNVDAIMSANAQSKSTVSIPIVSGVADSIFFYDGKIIAFSGLFEHDSISGTITKDSVIINRVTNVPLQGVIFWQRGKVLGLYRGWPAKKHWEAQLTSPNPNVRITDFEFIQIRRK